ncbi:glycosyl hydrolase [Cohnella sp. GCM10020058]|uniref:glycosyl hydrolase n=1 Tax=Cohnella sp. GCM10020058 TaxID=3317330 RepID=UPI0036341AD9
MKSKRTPRFLAATLIAALLVSVQPWTGGTVASAATPANANATQAVKDVLNYFDTVQANNQIISGQYVRGQTYGYTETDHVADLTSGKYPAMIGFDFLYNVTGPGDLSTWRSTIVDEGTDYWKRGGLVTASWHQTNPLDTTADAGGWNSVISGMSQANFNLVTTPGTTEYNKWLAHIDTIAGYLKSLRDQGVVVLWRPYHEMNGAWFWWGGKDPASYRKLWQNMYDRFTNYHGLNNLIWVWAPAKELPLNSAYYPGDAYVDLGGVDFYTSDQGDPNFSAANSQLTAIMGSKRFGLSEVGLVPHAASIPGYDYTWFLTWAIGWSDNSFYGTPPENQPGNTPYQLTTVYNHAATITRDEVPAFGRTIVSGTPIFRDAMNSYTAGNPPPNWTLATTGGTVTAVLVPSVGVATADRSMKINKTSTTNAATAEKSFGAQTGVVTFKATVRTEDLNWKDFIVYDSASQAALHIGLQGGYIKAYDGTTLSSIAPIANGAWYNLKVVMNTATKKFDIYVNGVKVANQFSFKNPAAADVSKLKVGVAADATGIYYIDNVLITK